MKILTKSRKKYPIYPKKERNTDTLKRLEKLIKENEKAIENLIKAIETGKAVDMITAQIEKCQSERINLEA